MIESQNAAILDWLQQGESITALEAQRQFGCMRLSGRIYDLRQEGHPIQGEMVCVRSQGRRKWVKQYWLP